MHFSNKNLLTSYSLHSMVYQKDCFYLLHGHFIRTQNVPKLVISGKIDQLAQYVNNQEERREMNS
jgi:hypothetical protein